MSFIETRFPEEISEGSRGGPGFQTGVIVVDSGHERRRVRWPLPRHMYDVSYGVKKPNQLEELIQFFYAMQGKAYGFRFKDPLDYKTCAYADTVARDDVQLLVATGGEQDIQLFKPYVQATQSVNRLITKPVNGTVLIEKNGALQTETTHYTIDYTTGILSFVSPLIASDVVKWGGEFDVPCRFDIDRLEIEYNGALVGNTEIPVVEVRI